MIRDNLLDDSIWSAPLKYLGRAVSQQTGMISALVAVEFRA